MHDIDAVTLEDIAGSDPRKLKQVRRTDAPRRQDHLPARGKIHVDTVLDGMDPGHLATVQSETCNLCAGDDFEILTPPREIGGRGRLCDIRRAW